MSAAHLAMNARRWQAIRVAVFTRDSYRCRNCGQPGRLECDHIQPLRRGGDAFDMANLQTLCRGCHVAKTRHESGRPDTPEAAAWRALRDELRG